MTIKQQAWTILEYLENPATYKGGDDPALKYFLNTVEQLCLDIVYKDPKTDPRTYYDQ
jgi:hypothetical protein